MTYCSLRRLASVAGVLALAGTLAQAAQIRRQPSAPAQVAVEAAVHAGNDTVSASGQGTCTHAPKGSIYGTVAELWNVQFQAGERNVQLTLWKPLDGSASMFSLSLGGRRNVSVSTIKGGQVMGSGTVTLAPAGEGGTFTLDAKTRTGEAVTGTIKCDRFTPHIAEGGN